MAWRSDRPVRALRSGEVVPPEPDGRDHSVLGSPRKTGYEVAAPPREVEAWAVVIRFADSAGQQWEVRNRRHPLGQLTVRRLRSGRLDLWRRRRDWRGCAGRRR